MRMGMHCVNINMNMNECRMMWADHHGPCCNMCAFASSALVLRNSLDHSPSVDLFDRSSTRSWGHPESRAWMPHEYTSAATQWTQMPHCKWLKSTNSKTSTWAPTSSSWLGVSEAHCSTQHWPKSARMTLLFPDDGWNLLWTGCADGHTQGWIFLAYKIVRHRLRFWRTLCRFLTDKLPSASGPDVGAMVSVKLQTVNCKKLRLPNCDTLKKQIQSPKLRKVMNKFLLSLHWG